MRQLLLMFGLISVLGALASPASGSFLDAPKELVKPDVAAARVATCGFKNVRPRFDDTLQEDVVEVLDVASASEEQLRCVALASLQSHYYVTFPASVGQAYQTLYWRMSRERDKTNARAWLEKRGLLSRLPAYDPKRSDETTFAPTEPPHEETIAVIQLMSAMGGKRTLERRRLSLKCRCSGYATKG